jgi:hypothetical protein
MTINLQYSASKLHNHDNIKELLYLPDFDTIELVKRTQYIINL